MRAGSAIASGARHVTGMAVQALLLVAIVAALVFATAMTVGRGPAGADSVLAARLTVTIAFADASSVATSSEPASGDVSFAVTRSKATDDVMWVTNRCFDTTGAEVSRVDLPVRWGMWYSLDGVAGPFATAGVSCTAYATWKPWTNRAIPGATMDYDVQN